MADTGVIAGVPAKNNDEPTAGSLIFDWQISKPSKYPHKREKKHIELNKFAIEVGATNAKAQGAMRRTDVGENGFRVKSHLATRKPPLPIDKPAVPTK